MKREHQQKGEGDHVPEFDFFDEFYSVQNTDCDASQRDREGNKPDKVPKSVNQVSELQMLLPPASLQYNCRTAIYDH